MWTNFLLLKRLWRPSHQAIASGKSAAFESADELNDVWAQTETGDDGDTASTGDSSTELLSSGQKSPSAPKKLPK